MTNQKFADESKEMRDNLYSINSIMDHFSNEFMRVENFLERYLPL